MELNVFKQKTSNMFAENRLLKFGFIALTIMIAMMWTQQREALKSVRTVIVPIGMHGVLEVSDTSASDDYLRGMARFITGMIGTYTAATARKQLEELMPLFSPETFVEAKTHFTKLANEIEKYPSVTSMVAWTGTNPLQVEPGVLHVTATKTRLVNGKVSRSETIAYQIKYSISGGRFWLTSLEETVHETSENN